ncbi:MAG: LLM class flavin-dependent oxidoreductase [Betaproteobacteria bacterium]|nr:LLM class flavin-dependent oxidoreductase [Betaproteobacteria bacterium]
MKIGLHYSLQVAPGERSADVMRDALTDIAWADRHGFSCALFSEHHFMADCWIPQPMQMAAAAAAITTHLRVGTDICVLPLHHPVAVAEQAAVLDNVSGGRAILGVGLGWARNEYDGFGVPYTARGAQYERSIMLVKRLLAGERVDSDDGHYRFKGAQIRPLPVNPGGIPLWIAAIRDVALPRVARLGDSWIMWPGATIAELARQKKIVSDARAAAGLPPMREQPLRRETFVADTDAKAWEIFADGIRHEYGQVYRAMNPGYPDNDSLDNLRRWGAETFAIGSPQTVAAQFKRYRDELGVTEILARIQLPNVPRGAVRDCLDGLREVMTILARG